jgi:hypothetical protein
MQVVTLKVQPAAPGITATGLESKPYTVGYTVGYRLTYTPRTPRFVRQVMYRHTTL